MGKEVSNLQAKVQSLESDLKSAGEGRDEWKRLHDIMEGANKTINSERTTITLQRDHLQTSKDKLQRERDALEAELTRTKRENSLLKADDDLLRERVESLERGRTEGVGKISGLKDKLEDARMKMSSKDERLKTLQRLQEEDIQEWRTSAGELETERDELLEEKAELQQEIEELSEERNNTVADVELEVMHLERQLAEEQTLARQAFRVIRETRYAYEWAVRIEYWRAGKVYPESDDGGEAMEAEEEAGDVGEGEMKRKDEDDATIRAEDAAIGAAQTGSGTDEAEGGHGLADVEMQDEG